jgi:hypothetical protein
VKKKQEEKKERVRNVGSVERRLDGSDNDAEMEGRTVK